MTRLPALLIALALLLVPAAAFAQSDPAVEAALASGKIGEQADGYLGYAKPVGADLKAKVEAINIKRRSAYTDLANRRGVSVQSAAAATACQTLGRLPNGRAFLLPGGTWQLKSAPIPLPDFCG